MADNQVMVKYYGTNVGKIYFSDVDRRRQLGGAPEGRYIGGQDEYIIWGEVKILELTGDVLFSMKQGVLKYFSTEASNSVFAHNGAPLTLIEGTYTSADEVPRQDIGDTGTSRFTDAYLAILGNDKYGPTGVAGATGYYYGQSL